MKVSLAIVLLAAVLIISGCSFSKPPGIDQNDLSSMISALPDRDALETICDQLGDSWTAAPNQYSSFTMLAGFFNREGTLSFGYGLYATEFGRFGEIIDSYAISKYEMALVIFIPAQPPGGELFEGYPESIKTVYVDVSGFSASGQIRIKIEGFAGGEWHTYTQGQ